MSFPYPSGCPWVPYLHHISFALKRNISDIFILLDSGHFNQLNQKFFSRHKFILKKRNPLHGNSRMTPKYCINLMRGYLITLRSLKNSFNFRGLSIIQNTWWLLLHGDKPKLGKMLTVQKSKLGWQYSLYMARRDYCLGYKLPRILHSSLEMVICVLWLRSYPISPWEDVNFPPQ